MNCFAKSRMGRALDALARTYGKRPSEIVGLNPDSSRSLLLDLTMINVGMIAMIEASTLAGNIKQKQIVWPKEIRDEVNAMKRRGEIGAD